MCSPSAVLSAVKESARKGPELGTALVAVPRVELRAIGALTAVAINGCGVC